MHSSATLPAIVLGHQPLPLSPELALPHTRARHCPACLGEQIAPVGHVIAVSGMIYAERRCEVCRTGFFYVRKPTV